jgi:hypothetical protein
MPGRYLDAGSSKTNLKPQEGSTQFLEVSGLDESVLGDWKAGKWRDAVRFRDPSESQSEAVAENILDPLTRSDCWVPFYDSYP